MRSEELPTVVSLSQLYEVEPANDLVFVRVKVSDEIEAKCRAVLIAILTASYLKGSDCFAKVYT